MASGWVKSLHCKSRAFDDVYHPNSKTFIPSASCRKSIQNIKEMVDIPKPRPRPKKPKPKPSLAKHHSSKYPASTKLDFETPLGPTATMNRSQSGTAAASAGPITELPDGHPSRNVVDIIFHTSWGPKPFPGRVEMIFKIQNGARTVSRFEEFREAVKARAASAASSAALAEGNSWEENARCVADGNEVMRFHCLGPTGDGGPYGGAGGGCRWSFPERKGSAICTFSGSGTAHESAGGGRGKRAMLVCRVVAGRVTKQLGFVESLLLLEKRVGFDSVSGENGELLVFDSRAVLPCFLIIYRL